ncbi:hypothetical protein ACH0B5_07220 [Ureibacillus sp. 179-F W5.1 NHS]|uniref:hypothetical protein n=1 Tax=Ureibacillus sp. 179-F W5.1 NHS TaxID=3374297 RepID=UPI003879BD87
MNKSMYSRKPTRIAVKKPTTITHSVKSTKELIEFLANAEKNGVYVYSIVPEDELGHYKVIVFE